MEKIIEHVFKYINHFHLLTYVGNLIRIPSYLDNEMQKCDYLLNEMKNIGLETLEVIIGPSIHRRNILGYIRGVEHINSNAIVCAAHIDTHWPQKSQEEIAHSGRVIDGKILGVGAGDSMTPLAAFLSAFDAIKKSGICLKKSACFLATVDELGSKKGAKILEEYGFKADMCLIGEQTDMNIGIVHSGKVEVEVQIEGNAPSLLQGHAERIGLKVGNAVTAMVKVINNLENMVKEEPYFHKKHPLLPGEGAAFYIGPIIGGNTGYGNPNRGPGIGTETQGLAVPSPTWCKLRVGARYWPGQSAQEFVDLVNKWSKKAISDFHGITVTVNCYLDHGNTPLETNPNAQIVSILRSAIKQVANRDPELIGSVYSTEGPFFQRLGAEVAWCAPGIMRVGSPNEHVTIEELETYCKIYISAIIRACGVTNN
jgi:acetylornithine deacetylase/succinyl-diaminopimelate desuccinylase-like protein